MMVNDPIGDMLTRIRNALMVKKKKVVIPASKLKVTILELLKREGFIEDFQIEKRSPQDAIIVTLKYYEGESVIRGLKRISKPGRHLYVKAKDMPRVKDGLGIAVISTSQGVKSDKECRRLGIGGEILCEVW